jgi:putative 2-oxoglutarate-Fe(II)-dependent oxygenase superfamily protein
VSLAVAMSPELFACRQALEIEPKPGLLVIFPAWLQYCVHPFFGMGHRISITMNITLEEE